ncbi:MAG: hypothetical protein GXO81_00395 [Chlorobi bacterium]|nr:hypothetical protein [Chlorobiota bacterium]
MKKRLLRIVSIFLGVLMLNLQTFGYTPIHFKAESSSDVVNDILAFNDSEVYDAFAEINDLTQFVADNEGVTYTDLEKENSELISKVSASASLSMQQDPDELALGIPSFLWGCVFGIIGVLVVYIMTDENKEQTKKAFWGCVAGTAVSVVIYVVAFGVATTSTGY